MGATELQFRVRRHYNGWLIVGVLFFAAALTIGSSNYAFGMFIEPLETEFGWPRTAISASLSFAAVGSLMAPILGRLLDHYGSRPLLIGSLSMIGLSFILRPLMTELWHWYLLSFLQFAPFAAASSLTTGRLVGIWFKKNRNRVMGITMVGNNFGGLTMPIVIGVLISNYSWQWAFIIIGIICIAIAILALFVVHERPNKIEDDRQYDEYPFFNNNDPTSNLLPGWTLREASKTRSFYAMTLAMMMASFTYSTVLPHISAHLVSNGLENQEVYSAIGILAIFGMIGKLSFGYIAEHITARRTMMLSLGGQIVSILFIVAYPSTPQIWLSAPLFGFFMGGYGTLVPLIVQESFGLRHFGSISGLATMATAFTFFAGPLMAGASFEYTNSYSASFLIVAFLFGTGIILLTQAEQAYNKIPE